MFTESRPGKSISNGGHVIETFGPMKRVAIQIASDGFGERYDIIII